MPPLQFTDIVNRIKENTLGWGEYRIRVNFINRYGIEYLRKESFSDNLNRLDDEQLIDFLLWSEFVEKNQDIKIGFEQWKEDNPLESIKFDSKVNAQS